MIERQTAETINISPGKLYDFCSYDEAHTIIWRLISLTPQVAMWKMAQESNLDAVFRTNSRAVAEYVREHYFLIRTREIVTSIAGLAYTYESHVYNCGIEFILAENVSDEIFREDINYIDIGYPKTADKYRFMQNFNPASIESIKNIADQFGDNTNLHAFYNDAVAFWVQETGLPYSADLINPVQITNHWNEIHRLEVERKLTEAKKQLEEIWNDVKTAFTNAATSEERHSIAFDMIYALQHGWEMEDAIPDEFPPLECQSSRDDEMIYKGIEESNTSEEFFNSVIKADAERLIEERGYRQLVNEVWIEIQTMKGNTEDLVQGLLEKLDLFKTNLEWWIVFDQLELINRIVGIYQSLEQKDEVLLRNEIAKYKWIARQELEDVVQYLISNKPENIKVYSEDVFEHFASEGNDQVEDIDSVF